MYTTRAIRVSPLVLWIYHSRFFFYHVSITLPRAHLLPGTRCKCNEIACRVCDFRVTCGHMVSHIRCVMTSVAAGPRVRFPVVSPQQSQCPQHGVEWTRALRYLKDKFSSIIFNVLWTCGVDCGPDVECSIIRTTCKHS